MEVGILHLLHNFLGDLYGELAHACAAELLHDPIPSSWDVLLRHVRSSVAKDAVYEVGGIDGGAFPPYEREVHSM